MNCWITYVAYACALWSWSTATSAQSQATEPDAAAAASSPDAVEPAHYRAIVDEALGEHERYNFEEARALYERASALYPSARTLQMLGTTEFELKRYAQAIQHLEQALASQLRPLSAEHRAAADELLMRAKRFVGRIMLQVVPPGARVAIDGIPVVPAQDGSVAVQIGERSVDVSSDGYETRRVPVVVHGGTEQRLSIALEPVHRAPAAALAAREEEDESSTWASPWLWTGVGAVVAGAVVTGVLLASSSNERVVEPVTTINTPPGFVVAAE